MNKKIKITLIVIGGLIASYVLLLYYLNHYYYIEKKIGDIQVCNSNLRIALYKTPKFDHNIPVHYQLYKGDSLLQDHQFLIGTDDFDNGINSFIPLCEDSIFKLAIFEEKIQFSH
jgi:hypothetical protein